MSFCGSINLENIFFPERKFQENKKATPSDTLSIPLKISRLVWLYGMSNSQLEMKKAVDCGYWHLYRYDPRRVAEGKNPFQLDSPEPDTDKLLEFLMGENRFSALKNNFPEKADILYAKEVADCKARYEKYRRLAQE